MIGRESCSKNGVLTELGIRQRLVASFRIEVIADETWNVVSWWGGSIWISFTGCRNCAKEGSSWQSGDSNGPSRRSSILRWVVRNRPCQNDTLRVSARMSESRIRGLVHRSGPVTWGSLAVLVVVLAGVIIKVPVLSVILVLGFVAIVLAVSLSQYLPRMLLVSLGSLLLGYAFLGRGFARLGVEGVFFVGEVVLVLGLLAIVVVGGAGRVFRSPVSKLLVLFIGWGAIRTLPYIGTYGFDALRDAVIWGYGTFAVLVGWTLMQTGRLLSVVENYGRWVPRFLLWVPLSQVILASFLVDYIPVLSAGEVEARLLHLKPGDSAVHLAGCAIFLILGLQGVRGAVDRVRPVLKEAIWWVAWLVGFLIVATANRGGLVAILGAIAVVVAFRPISRWMRVVLLGAVLAAVLLFLDIEIERDRGRSISTQQLVENIQSVYGGGGRSGLAATREWRLNWWRDILDYTVFGPYFLTGKGYGINLALDDGYGGRGGNRSPHNGHMTILARSGVPGLVLWLLLQGAFAFGLVRAYFRALATGRDLWARVNLWLLGYWTAFMLNGMFDVFLEGPQGGIWFWSVFGFGIAALGAQSQKPSALGVRVE